MTAINKLFYSFDSPASIEFVLQHNPPSLLELSQTCKQTRLAAFKYINLETNFLSRKKDLTYYLCRPNAVISYFKWRASYSTRPPRIYLNGPSVTGHVLDALATCFPHLTNLRLAQCSALTDQDIIPLVKRCHSLESFKVRHCSTITSQVLLFLAKSNPHLRSYHLKCCSPTFDGSFLNSLSVVCPQLEDMKVISKRVVMQVDPLIDQKLPLLRKFQIHSACNVEQWNIKSLARIEALSTLSYQPQSLAQDNKTTALTRLNNVRLLMHLQDNSTPAQQYRIYLRTSCVFCGIAEKMEVLSNQGPFDQTLIRIMTQTCVHLKSLTLPNCESLTLISIAQRCRQLKSLKVHLEPQDLTDAVIINLATLFLQKFILSRWCHTDPSSFEVSIRKLVQLCPHLRKLAFPVSNLSTDLCTTLASSPLKELRLSQGGWQATSEIPFSAAQSLSLSTHLRTLKIYHCQLDNSAISKLAETPKLSRLFYARSSNSGPLSFTLRPHLFIYINGSKANSARLLWLGSHGVIRKKIYPSDYFKDAF